MSRSTYPQNWSAQKEAWLRLALAYFPGRDYSWAPLAGDVIDRLSLCAFAHQPDNPLNFHPGDAAERALYPEPSWQDAVDALQWVGDARRTADHNELVLIDHAVSHGASWDEVGKALGWYGKTAGADARRHRARLAAKLGVKRSGGA